MKAIRIYSLLTLDPAAPQRFARELYDVLRNAFSARLYLDSTDDKIIFHPFSYGWAQGLFESLSGPPEESR